MKINSRPPQEETLQARHMMDVKPCGWHSEEKQDISQPQSTFPYLLTTVVIFTCEDKFFDIFPYRNWSLILLPLYVGWIL